MIPFNIQGGLLFVPLTIEYRGNRLVVANALVDTGSAATVVSASITENIGISYEPADILRRIRGVGGSEFVYEKTIDTISIGDVQVNNFAVQISGSDYGFEIDAIIGLDLLTQMNAVIDLHQSQMSVALDVMGQNKT